MSDYGTSDPSQEWSEFLGRHDDALRQLFTVSLDPDLDMDEKISRLLKLGCYVLNLPLGIVSRIDGSVYRVHHVTGPDWAPDPGAEFNVSETYCTHTLVADDVSYFHHAGESEIADHPCYLNFGLESYIGVPLRVGTTRIGTLNFSGPDERKPFRAMETELVRLFGRWLGQELLKSERARELAEKTMLLNAIIEAVPDAIIAADDDRRIRMINSSGEMLFGFGKGNLIGQSTSVLYPSVDAYEHQGERIYSKAREKAVNRFEMDLRRKDGSTFPGEVFMAPLRSEMETRLGIVGVVRDITQEKSLRMAKDELISTVSHELRTPITSVSGAVKLLALERDRLSENMQKVLDTAARNSDLLSHLVEDILDFERLSSAGFVADQKTVELPSVVEQAVDDIGPYATQHDVQVSLIPPEGQPQSIKGDKLRLLQVLSNLLSNAIKASLPGGKVEAGIITNGDGFWVRDYGHGIPLALQKRLFERFTRAPESYTTSVKGTGLGMSIVKAIVDHHGGRIEFETEEGKGTTFVVSLDPQA
ncbi:Alkaline phosphatase synthesis sensor protein PhoR (plasmid) [Roseovarius sp. THAF27]|nr:ATP-binding protein [Roseovarius sp. THAF8]QFT83130.1 Alkaline phosphatase synthesis sensor protein PhoR [Roseovarius sp. THAF27]QFT99671.1 Alkaline phosphatase synthesis sensor protein PhoR [Roseovarius sp. THAF8]